MRKQDQKDTRPEFDVEKYKQMLKNVQSMKDITGKDGLIQTLLKSTIENVMKAELEDHLGYAHNDARNKNTENSRNGYSPKTLKTSTGSMEIEVPRDRHGTYEPKVVQKYETIDSDFEEKIISMYAKGMTTRDISTHIKELYGADISPSLISKVTDKIMTCVTQWRARSLDELYPVVFFDAIHYKVQSDGKVISKAIYVCLGITIEGKKDILGLYAGENESASFWLSVLTDLQVRGVQDILIACIDGLKGFPEAIKTIFPRTESPALYRSSDQKFYQICFNSKSERIYEGFKGHLSSNYTALSEGESRCFREKMGAYLSYRSEFLDQKLRKFKPVF